MTSSTMPWSAVPRPVKLTAAATTRTTALRTRMYSVSPWPSSRRTRSTSACTPGVAIHEWMRFSMDSPPLDELELVCGAGYARSLELASRPPDGYLRREARRYDEWNEGEAGPARHQPPAPGAVRPGPNGSFGVQARERT